MIYDIVRDSLRANYRFAAGQKVILAVSGGCDSLALLHIFLQLREQLDIDLHVASLDHGLRGAAGQADAEFVGDLARRWQLPYTLGAVDVPRLAAAENAGLEAAARRARYRFLATVAAAQGSHCVLTGHQAQDQVETMLLHIVRGSGLRGLVGLRGLAPLPYAPTIDLLRPLLSLSRGALEAYCARHNLRYRDDKSNKNTAYRRNFLRQEVLGQLRQLNPDLLGAFGRLAEAAAVDEAYLAMRFAADVLPLAAIDAESWQIDRQAFAGLHPAMQRRFLRAAYQALAGDGAALSHKLTLELLAWLPTAPVGKRRDLGAAIALHVAYTELRISRGGAAPAAADYRLIAAATDIVLEGAAPLCLAGLKIGRSDSGAVADCGRSLALPRDCELRLRTRRPGDRFKPLGMGGRSRKIKDWLLDRKVPRALRDQIPLLCADGAIVAVCLGPTWHLADTSDFSRPSGATQYICLE